MSIYDKPVWQLLKDMVAALNLSKGQTITKSEINLWFQKNYPRIKKGTISSYLVRMSTNAPGRIYHNPKPYDDFFFQVDGSRFRLYDPTTDPPPINRTGDSSTFLDGQEADIEDSVASASGAASEFAYESDLKNFLAKHLSVLEPDLRLYEEEGMTGVEFPAGGRFIDILAVDRENSFVVIELKVSRGYDRVVGQLLRYMGWVNSNLADPNQGVRGIIVARQITEDLKLACQPIVDVALYEYELSVSVHKINKTGTNG
jgi:hypothetical protein